MFGAFHVTMLFRYLALFSLLVMPILTVSENCSSDLAHVPGCILISGDFDSPGTIATCSNFNIISTPPLLPKCTTKLQIYFAKKIPTDVPLVPQLQLLSILELTDNGIHNVSKVMFEGLQHLKCINLKRNFIKYLPPDVFSNNMNLESVDISGNHLTSLESVAVAVAALNSLKTLYVSDNRLLRWIRNDDFIPLNNSPIMSLDISGCTIQCIESNAFQPLKFLTSLNVSLNPLSEEGLTNLSQSLKRENLMDLSAYAMTDMPYFSCMFLRWLHSAPLEYLDLSRNRFVCFPKGNYPNLKVLVLDECDTLQLYGDFFSKMPELEFLSLKKHKLTGIENEFKSNSRLKVLDLRYFVGNKIVSVFKISNFAFENMKELLDLRLDNLPMKGNITRYMLHGLTNVRTLSFYSDRIRSIDCFAFETLRNLTRLDLSHNSISELLNCTFYGLINVKIINLSINDLTFFNETYPFQYTPNLEILLLNRNKIVKFPDYIFRNLHVELISLQNNSIQPWYHEFLPEGSSLTTLLLDENAITHFTQKMLDDLSKIQHIRFSKNPINCSHCSIVEFQRWMKNKSLDIPNLNQTGNYVCYAPNTLRKVDILTANISSTTHHCFLPEEDFLTPLYIIFSFMLSVAVLSMVVWHRWSWNIKYCIFLTRLRTKRYKNLLDSRTFAFDAYVSYCESNLEWIESHLVPALEGGSPKIRLCLPDRNFDAGCSIVDNIVSAIDRSRSTLIIVSNDYLDSSWCLYNIQMAQNILYEKMRSGLIIVFLEDVKKNKIVKDIRYVLRTRTCIWWTENQVGQKLFWERLRLSIMRPDDKGISTHIT